MRRIKHFILNGVVIVSTILLVTDIQFAMDEDSEEKESKTELAPASNPLQPATFPLEPLANRWRLLDAYGVEVPRYSIIDPYNQNPLKGDFPIMGRNTFMVLTGIYNPAGVFNSQDNIDAAFNNKFVTEIEFFHGTTVFRPKTWSIKAAGEGFFNRGNVDNEDFGLKQLFGEIKLFETDPFFDFGSIRGGIQFFKSDFNGFVFQDFNLGAQFFGELNENRYRYALAYFSQREKDNGFVTFDELNQDVVVANWVAEDIISPGFINEFSIHYNRDRQLGDFDLDVLYLGFASDGHWGRIEFNPAFYLAIGSEDFSSVLDTGEILESSSDIRAFFGGVEVAYPEDYFNFRGAVFFASGDSDPNDDTNNGFDSILDNINLFGGNTSFLIGGGAFGTRNNSFIPSFRPLGTRSNFVNPGMLFGNLGLDMIFTPKLFFESNVNYFQFLTSDVLPTDSKSVGFEVNGAFAYRIDLNENLVFKVGGNIFFPQDGAVQNGVSPFLADKDVILTGNLTLVALF
ncbi:hypothetical protein GWO43_11620 [candidate division KSB1 bacterium]|nr:hypothetical protein [candidate division KSB1 bacterium]NIR70747.1 hypothetical protein [candidate division KSB1 bacterium]NIS24605.1 hypothetical protein [candidate division KSB1 bacterium]NIT71514.1 hypothetical protein [candidate division KSB1 bacterium]NIU25205.1 hypothetical protein [candidate division KSB1 bacterium]